LQVVALVQSELLETDLVAVAVVLEVTGLALELLVVELLQKQACRYLPPLATPSL
jgi:hypothetical protein